MQPQDKYAFPNSWFRIATSKELQAKKVIPLRYFERDLVLFRTATGTPCVLDAHCPHLGAHLGYGGAVEGNAIRCPYHGWLWDERGHCIDIPYSDRCRAAKVTSYPTMEANGLILMYYHNEGKPPTWQIPIVAECDSSEWTPLRFVHRWQARTNLQNYLDNSVDVAHLSQVHRQTFAAAQSNRVEIEGPILTHQMSQKYNLSSLASGGLISEDGSATTTYYGPGYDVSLYRNKGRFNLELLQIFTGTPIDRQYLDIQIFLSVRKVLPMPLTWLLTAMFVRDTINTFKQDIPILENKVYQSHPLLLKEDGPIAQSRRWVRQFYQ